MGEFKDSAVAAAGTAKRLSIEQQNPKAPTEQGSPTEQESVSGTGRTFASMSAVAAAAATVDATIEDEKEAFRTSLPQPHQRQSPSKSFCRTSSIEISLLSSESIFHEDQQRVLRTTPGAFAIRNPLATDESSLSTGANNNAAIDETETITTSATPQTEDSDFLPPTVTTSGTTDLNSSNCETMKSQQQPICLSAVCVHGPDSNVVYEGRVVEDSEDSDDGNSIQATNSRDDPTKKRITRNTMIASIFVATVIITTVALVFLIKNVNPGSDQQESQNVTLERTQSPTSDIDHDLEKSLETENSGESVDIHHDEREDYLISILASISGPAGANVFDWDSNEKSLNRIATLDWLVKDTNQPLWKEIPAWKIRQRYVLALLYQSTKGSGDNKWDKQTGFQTSGVDECLWNIETPETWQTNSDPWFMLDNNSEILGVGCNEEGRVQRITLRWNELSGTIPHELSYFNDTLEELDLGNSAISGTIPDSFGKLTKLKSLHLNDNCLSGTIPNNLFELPNLQILALHNNILLEGSVNDFCYSSDVSREENLAVSVDCAGDSGQVQCDCCICCDHDSFDCFDQQSGNEWKSYNLNVLTKKHVSGFEDPVAPKSFMKKYNPLIRDHSCHTNERNHWIDEECRCYIEADPKGLGGKWEENNRCTQDCRLEGAQRSDPFDFCC